MKKIKLSKGMAALVDNRDYEYLSQWKWSLKESANLKYAVRGYSDRGKMRWITMHRQIMQPPAGMVIDHINSNGLDNRRKNLRICNQWQNMHNRRGQHSHRGVTNQGKNRWVVNVHVNGKHIYFGTFADRDAASRIYNEKARELLGEFAILNKVDPLFPDGSESAITMSQARLRQKTHSQSGYRGVSKHQSKWVAQISSGIHGTPNYLGTFDTPEDAARAYNIAAIKKYGNSANLNAV